MTKILGALVIALPMLAMMPTSASAWYCEAHAPNGAYGWATRYNLYAARRAALWECAVRTPRYLRCYITTCY